MTGDEAARIARTASIMGLQADRKQATVEALCVLADERVRLRGALEEVLTLGAWTAAQKAFVAEHLDR